ncbi:hypothetical protein COHA_004196 [Chlorella ohadii]|uniref:Rhodanese domain-containing protein n=1 Tax=Chlorella ohadii TaxID=2649997 RepID=A0AAD5DU76_9CHLO|nr:hypothetical protein COHA_004196 [Chlorella ohadii]
MPIAATGCKLPRRATMRPALGAGAGAARPPLRVAASAFARSPVVCSSSSQSSCTRRGLLLGTASGAAAGVLSGSLPASASPAHTLLRPDLRPAGGSTVLPPLVDVEWLQQQAAGQVKLLDASWHPGAPGAGAADFQAGRIPGARFCDLAAISDTSASLPLMLPSPAAFGAAADALGISPQDIVVVYDGRGPLGQFTAARAWWMWHVMGHDRVAMLDGGLPAWEAADGAVDASPANPKQVAAPAAAVQHSAVWNPPRYRAQLQADEVRGWQDMMRSMHSGWEQIVDARPADRYYGRLPEAPGLKAGHIPGAINLPAASLLSGGRFLPVADLRSQFASAGVDLTRPMVMYCMTGIQAATVVLAAQLVAPGARCALYDGGWSEWGGLPGVPIVQPPVA